VSNFLEKAVISCIIIFSILSQSLIYDSGLCYMRKVRHVCTCNHNSKKEIHSTKISKTDCHDLEKIIHVCSCKTTKNPNELSNFIKQIFIFTELNLSSIDFKLVKYAFLISLNFPILEGFHLTLIKPPKLT
jgi:hypothetical protein